MGFEITAHHQETGDICKKNQQPDAKRQEVGEKWEIFDTFIYKGSKK